MTTINKEEIQKFSNLADEWWDVNGKFKPLHMFNPIRIEYITESIKNYYKLDKSKNNFLHGLNILDIGCGPGSGMEAWIDLGLNAKGVEPDISRAKYGIKKGLNISTSRWEEYDLKSFPANVYTSMQSLEHFYNAQSFIESLSQNINEIFTGNVDRLSRLEELKQEVTKDTKKVNKLEKLLNYIVNNKNCIVNYDERKNKDLVFTSQMAESNVESLINQRCKGQQHMKWSRDGLHNILTLRAAMNTYTWSSVWEKHVLFGLKKAA